VGVWGAEMGLVAVGVVGAAADGASMLGPPLGAAAVGVEGCVADTAFGLPRFEPEATDARGPGEATCAAPADAVVGSGVGVDSVGVVEAATGLVGVVGTGLAKLSLGGSIDPRGLTEGGAGAGFAKFPPAGSLGAKGLAGAGAGSAKFWLVGSGAGVAADGAVGVELGRSLLGSGFGMFWLDWPGPPSWLSFWLICSLSPSESRVGWVAGLMPCPRAKAGGEESIPSAVSTFCTASFISPAQLADLRVARPLISVMMPSICATFSASGSFDSLTWFIRELPSPARSRSALRNSETLR
jgi:hypothetical protein